MQATNVNGVKVYNVTSARSLATIISDKARKKAVRAAQVTSSKRKPSKLSGSRAIDLLQDFYFPCACQSLVVTPDGRHLLAAGTYKPQVKVFETDQLTMKFDRHVDSEIVRICPLADDWRKFATLQCDRYISFHAQFGHYFATRIPVYGRDLCYDGRSCELLAAGMSNEIYRLNLSQGRFLEPTSTNLEHILSIDRQISGVLLAAGGAGGVVEFWDQRSKSRAASLSSLGDSADISKVKFGSVDSTFFLSGTRSGTVHLYDLRMPRPLHSKEHQSETPIVSLSFHHSLSSTGAASASSADTRVVSSCERMVKIWDLQSGQLFTSMEPANDDPTSSGVIHDVCVPDSTKGLVFVAGEFQYIQSYFIPELGPAPRWCSFLDSLTEELEEGFGSSLSSSSSSLTAAAAAAAAATTTTTTTNTGTMSATNAYGDYKFVTRQDLDVLGLSHLIGTDLLKEYMHGFFVDLRLYQKARAIADPFEYERFRQEEVAKKLEAERQGRIVLDDRLKQKLNLLRKQQQQTDERFRRQLEEDADFAVDETSADYKRRHASSTHRGDSDDSDADDAADNDKDSNKEEEDDEGDADSSEEEEKDGEAGSGSETDEERIQPLYASTRRKEASLARAQKKREREKQKQRESQDMLLQKANEAKKMKKLSLAEQMEAVERRKVEEEAVHRATERRRREEQQERSSKRRKMFL